MRCDEARTLIPELSRVEAKEGGKLKAAAMHLHQCSACQAVANQTAELWELLGRWEIPDPGPELGRAVKEEILRDLQRQTSVAPDKVLPNRFRGFLWPVALGLTSAIFSVVIGAHRIHAFSPRPSSLLTCGILWAGAYIVAFWLALDRECQAEQKSYALQTVRISALLGLIAMALCMIQARTCSLTTVVEYCEENPWLRAAMMNPVDRAVSFFVLGALYASVPMVAALMLVGRGRALESRTRTGAVSGLIYAALLLPAVYLQCGSFTLGASLVWMSGAAVGALGGGVSGSWLAWRKPTSATELA